MITTNDIKKGDRIKLANGWYGTMMDNKKGNTRMAEVEGIENELGSVYGHDIVQARLGGEWTAVQHTPQQVAARKANGDLFGFHYNDQTEQGL